MYYTFSNSKKLAPQKNKNATICKLPNMNWQLHCVIQYLYKLHDDFTIFWLPLSTIFYRKNHRIVPVVGYSLCLHNDV